MRARYVHPVERPLGTRYPGAWIHNAPLPRRPRPLTGTDLVADLAHVDRCCVRLFGQSARSIGLTEAVLGTILKQAARPLTAGQVAHRLAPVFRRARKAGR